MNELIKSIYALLLGTQLSPKLFSLTQIPQHFPFTSVPQI